MLFGAVATAGLLLATGAHAVAATPRYFGVFVDGPDCSNHPTTCAAEVGEFLPGGTMMHHHFSLRPGRPLAGCAVPTTQQLAWTFENSLKPDSPLELHLFNLADGIVPPATPLPASQQDFWPHVLQLIPNSPVHFLAAGVLKGSAPGVRLSVFSVSGQVVSTVVSKLGIISAAALNATHAALLEAGAHRPPRIHVVSLKDLGRSLVVFDAPHELQNLVVTGNGALWGLSAGESPSENNVNATFLFEVDLQALRAHQRAEHLPTGWNSSPWAFSGTGGATLIAYAVPLVDGNVQLVTFDALHPHKTLKRVAYTGGYGVGPDSFGAFPA